MLELVCSICAELFNETDDVYVTQCGHIFHYVCLCHWLSSSKTCPQCRRTCTDANIHKVFLESAIESSQNANLRAQLGTGSIQKAKQAIKDLEQALELYEEVNLNLKRELELNESNLDKLESKLVCLEVEHERVQNDLKKEIEMRENSEKQVLQLDRDKLRLTEMVDCLEIEKKRAQDELKMEIEIRQERDAQVAELEDDNLSLTKMVESAKTECNQIESDLEKEIKRRENIEKKVAELEKDNLRLTEIEEKNLEIGLKKEIELREISEKRVAELEKDIVHLKEITLFTGIAHNKMQNDLEKEIGMRENIEKRVAELEDDNSRLKEIVHRSEIEHKRVQNDLKMEIEKREICEKRVAELKMDKMRRNKMLDDLESWREKYSLNLRSSNSSGSQDAAESVNSSQKELTDLQKCNDNETPEPDATLFGIPRLPAENVESIFRQLCRTIEYTPPTLKGVFRSSRHNSDSPIIIKFGSLQERDDLFRAIAEYCKKVGRHISLKDFGITSSSTHHISLRESLTSRNRHLFEQAISMKRRKQLFSVYTRFGFVYVKQSANGTGTMIENEEMLNAMSQNVKQ